MRMQKPQPTPIEAGSRHLARPASMFPRYSADDWSPSLGCADLEHLAAIVEAETRRAAARDAPAAHSASLARAARMLVLSEKQVSVVGRERA